MSNGLEKKPNNVLDAGKVVDPVDKIEEKLKEPVKRYIRFLRIDDARQKKVVDEIKERSELDLNFMLLLVFSTIIVALGLITDNAAVVIGGMIIAPLIWPILALAHAIIRGNVSRLKKTAFTIVKATFVIFLVSFVLGIFSPHLGESRELLLRTNPTLYELFIALAAGFIGAFAVAHPKLSGALAGVVAAVALVPPLSAMGILFAQGNFVLASGAALLYLTNLIAMSLAAILLFLLVGMKFPRRESSKSMALSNISWFVIFLIIIAIPLTLVMRGVIIENSTRSTVRDVIESYTVSTTVTQLSVDSAKGLVVINATIQSPNELTSMHVRRLTDILNERLERSVNLTINVIPTYTASQNGE